MIETEEPLISIVIPVKNGDPWLEALLKRISTQTLYSKCEVIIIDSGSSDHSLQIIARYPITLIKIDSDEFNHGRTRNTGVKAARGKYIVMTVQDALPCDDFWLEKLLACFQDNTLAGACGQQCVPHNPEMNPVQWYRPLSRAESVTYKFENPADFLQLPPERKRQICGWDNVNSMYKKELLLQFPFGDYDFAEDLAWAKDIILNGYGIAYPADTRVYHYHFENRDFTFRRAFTEIYYCWRLFNYIAQSNSLLISFLKDAKLLFLEKQLSLSKKVRWLIYNYEMRRAVNEAITRFASAKEKGTEFLDETYKQICKISPVAPRPKKSNPL